MMNVFLATILGIVTSVFGLENMISVRNVICGGRKSMPFYGADSLIGDMTVTSLQACVLICLADKWCTSANFGGGVCSLLRDSYIGRSRDSFPAQADSAVIYLASGRPYSPYPAYIYVGVPGDGLGKRPILGGWVAGRIISISGRMANEQFAFAIHARINGEEDYALRVHVEINNARIRCSGRVGNTWAHFLTIDSTQPFAVGKNFTIEARADDNRMQLYADGIMLMDEAHLLRPFSKANILDIYESEQFGLPLIYDITFL